MKPRPINRLRSLLLAGSSLLAVSYSHAASGNWTDNTGNYNWSDATRWSSNPTVPGTTAGDIISFTNDISANRTITVNTTPRTVGILNIGDSNNSHGFTINASGGGTLTFDNSGSGAQINEVGSVADSITAPIILNDNLTASIGGALTLGGSITTSSGKTLTKTGTGTLTISGNNTHSANISSASGLSISTAGTTTFNGNLTLSGGTLGISSAGTTLAGSGLLTLSGGGAISVPNSGTGTTIDMNQQWNGNLATTLVSASGQTITSNGTITLNANVTVSNKATMIFNSGIGELTGPRNLTVTNNGGANTFIVNGTNTYSGSTTISSGIFRVGGSGTLGSGSYAGAISNVASFEYSSSTNQILSGAITGTNGTLTKNTSTASTLTLSGAGANTYTGLTTVSAGTLALDKSGAVSAIAGALTIGGANNTLATVQYTGASSNMMGTGAVTINGRGILDFNGKTDTIGNVVVNSTGATTTNPTSIINTAGGGNLTIGTLGITPVAGFTSVVNAGTGTITLGGDVTFTAATTGRAQISGTALSLGGANRNFNVGLGTGADYDLLIDAQITGARSLTKTGAGRLTLANTNAYTLGTTVSAGTLLLSGAFNMPGTGTLAVSANGTFSLADGTARATTGATTGVGLTLATGSWLAFDWNGGSLDSFTTGGTATSTGTVVININNTSPTGGGGTLITSSGVSTLNSATYLLANNTNYTATISKTTTTVSIGAQTAATALTNAYWKGGQVTGALGTMTVSTGSLSNWASDAAGTSVGVVPGGSAVNVIFGATGAAQQANVTTGLSDMNLGSITFNDTAAVTIAGAPNIITLNSTSGTAATTSGALATVTAGSAISVTSFANVTNTISANLALGANQTWNIASGKTLAVSGQVSGSGSLTKADTGTLTLSGGNTYTGGTTISAGTLKIGSTTALGAAAGAVIVASGATLDLNGLSPATANALTINGSGIGGNGALLNSSSSTDSVYSGVVTLGSNSTIGNTSSAKLLRFADGTNSTINLGAFTLTFKGAGTVNIQKGIGITSSTGGSVVVDGIYLNLITGGNQSVNNYNGTTTVQNGGAILKYADNIGTGNITLNGGYIDGYFNEGFARGFGTGSSQLQITGGTSGFGTNGNGNINFSNVTEVQWGTASFNPSAFLLGSVTSSAGTTTFQDGIDLNGATRTITTLSSANAGAVSGVIRNTSVTAAGLTKTGVGTLTLSNTNTFNGTTTISDGVLSLTNALALQNSALDTTNSVAGTATVGLKTTQTTLTLGGLIGNKDFDDTAGSVFTTASGGYSAVTALTLNVGTGNSHSYSGAIGNGAATTSLTKSGMGTQILSGTNIYTGNTLVSEGTLQFAKQVSLYNNGAAAAWSKTNINVNSGATMALNIGGSGEFTKANVITLLGLADATTNGFKTGAILGLDTTSGDFLYDSVIANPNGGTNVLGLTKLGTNKLTLDQTNTYTGATTITGGILQIGNAGTTGSLATTSAITNNATLAFNRSDTVTQGTHFANTIGGSGGVTQAGSGTLVLGGTNTYAGATNVNAGTLLINGSTSSTSVVTVNTGGTLGGTGTVGGSVTLNNGAFLSPGASIESLATGSNTWNGGSTFVFEFSTDGSTGAAGTEWDLLGITGTLDLTGASVLNPINFDLITMANATTAGSLGTWNPNANALWSGFVTTTSGINGFAANLFNIDTSGFQNSINGSFSIAQSGNNLDLIYTAVPEPRAALLGGLGLLMLLRRRRR